MKKLKFSNKFKIIFSVLVIGIILPIFIVCAFYRPTTLNKYIVNKLYNEPVNNYFTDQNFYNCVIDAYNEENSTSHDYAYNLSDEELSSINELTCSEQSIIDTVGLDKLTGLTYLNFQDNRLTELDVSKNTVLTSLDVSGNQLTELDVSKNTALTELYVSENQLTELDVSKNTALTELYVSENQLTELDVSKNTALISLYVTANQLTELDVSKNTVLTELYVSENQLTELDVSNNTALTSLDVSNNNFQKEEIVCINKLSNITAPLIPIEDKSNVITSYNVNNNSNITIDKENNTITSSKAGKYNLKLSYEYNYYSDKNALYDVDYTLYVTELTSTKYGIDNTNSIIYVPHNEVIDKNIIDNLHTNYGTIEFSDNKIKIKDNDKVIEEYDIVNVTISSDIYEIIDKYVYSHNLDVNLNYITASIGEVVIDNEIVKIMYNDTAIDTYKLIYVNSDEYKIDSDYVFVSNSTFSLDKINSNGTLSINNNKLELKDNDVVLKSFDIISIDFGDLRVSDKIIVINEEMSYSEFTNNITTTGATYKIEKDVTTSIDDPKYEEVTSGNITGGLLLRVYKNDEVIAYYSINEGYYRIIDTSVKVDQVRAYISNVKDRLTVEQIKQIVETSGTITVLDKEDNVKESTLLVGTGDKIKIDLGNDRIFTYTLIVKGDVDGDGEVTTIDALNIVNHILGSDELKDIYLKAGNVDEDDEMTTIDALNIINYILGKESSL